MDAKTARALVGGAFGAIPAWLLGFEGAALVAGVLEPIGRRLEAAKRAGHPVQGLHAGAIWHGWVVHQSYLPTHWGPVFGHPWLLLGAVSLGLLFGSLVALAASRASGVSSWGGPGARGRGQFGTAHWRPTAALAASYTHWQAPVTREKGAKVPRLLTPAEQAGAKRPVRAPVGLLVGADTLTNPLAGWILERDEHSMVLGSTRSGKTRRLILPTIGIVGTTAEESLVISDPKGELYDHTADWLRERGYRVWRIDLIRPRPGATQRFNPVAAVWTALHQAVPDQALAAKVARQIAHVVIHGSPGSLANTDPLWIDGKMSLCVAVILAVADRAPTIDAANLAAVYRLLVTAGSMDEGKVLDGVFEEFAPDHPARLAYSTYLLAQGKTRSSIVVSSAAALQLWGDPEIAWVTGDQDHDLATLADQPTAVFLVVPFEDASRYMAAGLYVSGLFRTLADVARSHQGRLPRRVTFLLDEFGNLPPLPDFDQFVTVSAGMGIRLVLALQNIEQLRKHYERVERTIRGNLGTWLFLRTSDLQTAKELAEMIGRYTLHSESTQAPKVGWLTSTSGVGHTSQGLSLTGRELVTTDELMRWPADSVLVWQAGYPPAKLPLPDLSAWSIFQPISERHPWMPPDTPLPAVSVWDPLQGPSLIWEGADALTQGKGGEAMLTMEDLGALGPLFAEGQEAPIDPDDEGPAFTGAAD